MYQEYPPSPLLSSHVDKYWEFKGNPPKGMRIHILPDGCTDFIFTLGEATRPEGSTLVMQPYRSYFVGPMTKYASLVALTDTVHMLGIRFRPCGVGRFAPLPLHELADLRVSTDSLHTLFDDSLCDTLAEKPGMPERIALIEQLLLRHLGAPPDLAAKRICHAVNRIHAAKGVVPIPRLADEVNLCPRHFERTFKVCTGFSPKVYGRIIQFRHAVDLLRGATFDNLLSVAVAAGYYDVSHLSKEVRRMSGNTPLSFLSASEPGDVALTYVTA